MHLVKIFSVVFIINIVDYLLAPLTTILVAKQLTIEEYGVFSFAGTLVGLIATFFTFGLGQYNYRTIPGRVEDEQYRVFGRSLFIQLTGTLIGAVAAMFFVRTDFARYGILLLFLLRIIFTITNTELTRFVGYRKQNVLKSIASLIDTRGWFLPLLFFLILGPLTLRSVFISMLIGHASTLVILLVILKPIKLASNIRPSKDFLKLALTASLPLVLVDLGMYLQEMAGRYILKIFCDWEQIGLFSFSYSWFALIFKFGMLLLYVLQPYFSETWYQYKQGNEEKKAVFQSQISIGFKYSFLLLGALSICFILQYQDVVTLVGKAQYAQSLRAAWILFLYPFAIFFAYFNQILMVLDGKTKILPLLYLISGGVNILLNLVLVQQIGYEGSAIATTVSYCILAILLRLNNKNPAFTVLLSGKTILKQTVFFVLLIAVNLLFGHLIQAVLFRIIAIGVSGFLILPLVLERKDFSILKNW